MKRTILWAWAILVISFLGVSWVWLPSNIGYVYLLHGVWEENDIIALKTASNWFVKPNLSNETRGLAEVMWFLEDTETAIMLLEKSLYQEPTNDVYRYLLAERMLDLGQVERATELFADESLRPLLIRQVRDWQASQASEMLPYLPILLEIEPTNLRGLRKLAVWYETQGKTEDAIATWQQVHTSINLPSIEKYWAQGEIFRLEKAWSQAYEAYLAGYRQATGSQQNRFCIRMQKMALLLNQRTTTPPCG